MVVMAEVPGDTEKSRRSSCFSSAGSTDVGGHESSPDARDSAFSLDEGVMINGLLCHAPLSDHDFEGEESITGKCPGRVRLICVGVMRTGLMTLHRALRNLGYSNIYDQGDIVSTYEHWDQVLRNRAGPDNLAQVFEGSEVIMGMPTFCFWEEIAALYPDAQVILTVRNEDEWWGSVRHAESLMKTGLPGAPLRYGTIMRTFERFLMPSYHKFCEVLRFAWATTLGAQALEGEDINEVVARSSYRKHNNYVKSELADKFVRGRPRLLVYDVREGWEPLCEFLNKEMPEVEFPSVLKVPYFPGQQTEMQNATCFEDHLLLPTSDFGIKLREELRTGLVKGAVILTSVLAVVICSLLGTTLQLSPIRVASAYLVIIAVIWNVYVIMHGLVLKVPALVVLPMAMKSLCIAGALQACFISYGILKEMLVTRDHIASPVLVLSSRLGAIICAAAYMLATDGSISLGAPVHSMAAFAFTNEASTWAGYEMLKYVSFPIQVMAKSAKMLPSMLMGRFLNKTRYTPLQYVQAVAALVCVLTMHLSDEVDHASQKGRNSGHSTGYHFNLAMGCLVLCLFFVCDSFTSQWQNALYKKHPKLTQVQMMLGGNLLGFLLTSGTFIASWAKVRDSLEKALLHPEVFCRIVCLGVVYAMGQFCIYSAIRILGPLSFTWIMTARQLISVLISLMLFGHGINLVKALCILVVFGIMSAKHLAKAVPRLSESAQQFGRAVVRRASSTCSTNYSRSLFLQKRKSV